MGDIDETNEPVLQPRQTTATVQNVGMMRLVSDLEPIEVTFILLAFVSIVGASIITVVRIVDSKPLDKVFAIVLFINLVFVLYYILHGVFRERAFEIFVSVIATVIVMGYCITEYVVKGYKDKDKNNHDLKLGRLIVISVIGPIDIVLGVKIAIKFLFSKSLIFKTVGGNAVLQNMCQKMFIFTAFLKFDFQLVVSMLVLIVNRKDVETSEKIILGIGVPLSFLWVILGFIMVRYELKRTSYTFWLVGLLEPAYIFWLFNRVAQDLQLKDDKDHYILSLCIIAAGVVALIVRVIVYICSIVVTRNFGKGLKEKVYPKLTREANNVTNYDTIHQE